MRGVDRRPVWITPNGALASVLLGSLVLVLGGAPAWAQADGATETTTKASRRPLVSRPALDAATEVEPETAAEVGPEPEGGAPASTHTATQAGRSAPTPAPPRARPKPEPQHRSPPRPAPEPEPQPEPELVFEPVGPPWPLPPPPDAGVADARASDVGVADAHLVRAAPPSAGAPPNPTSAWTEWNVGPPAQAVEGPSPFERIVERLDAALWPVVQVVVLVFLLLRLLSWLVRARAHAGRPTFVVIRRGWAFVEGTVWLLTIAWAIAQLSARQSPSATLLVLLVFALMVALSWNGLRDVTAGLILAAERPFALGDHVILVEGEGQVRAFRSRVLELESQDGLRIRVPYRHLLDAARVRKGGRRTTFAVHIELAIPEVMDPQEALRVARELAASSPWSVLGESARLELLTQAPGPRIRMVAFAFAADAQPLLHADLLAGWRDAGKR